MSIQYFLRDGGNLLVGIVLMAALAPVGTCGAVPTGENAQTSTEVSEEGTKSEKKTLNQLRRERDKAEQNFFAIFNTINSTDEYDVKCKYESSLATRRKRQVCTPKFAKKIRANATSDMMTEGQWDAPSPPGSLLAKQKESMRQEMTELLSTHEEFRRVFNDFAFAKRAYESALVE